MRGTFLSVLLCSGCTFAAACRNPSVDLALVACDRHLCQHRCQSNTPCKWPASPRPCKARKCVRRSKLARTAASPLPSRNGPASACSVVVVPWTIVDVTKLRRKTGRAGVWQHHVPIPAAAPRSLLALEHAAGLFASAPPANRRVIDLSTDGINNIGPPLDGIRRR